MGPHGWVFAYDAIFEILFALITLGIGFFSFKIYRFSKQRQLKNFGLSFLSISISFFILALLNFGIVDFLGFLKLESIGILRAILAFHMGFYIIGIITLAYMTLKLKSDTTYYILILITFLAIIAATHKLYLFYSIASVLLGYVFAYYLINYKRKKRLRNLSVMIGFGFLFLANVSLIFSVGNSSYYIVGHVLMMQLC